MLCKPSWKYSLDCDEGLVGVQKASLHMFWEHSPYLMNISSGWLISHVDEEEIKMDDGVARFFTHFGGIYFYLLTCVRHSLVLGIQNDPVRDD